MLANDVIAAEQLIRRFLDNQIEIAPPAVQPNPPLPAAAENNDGRVEGGINYECHICTFVRQVRQNQEMVFKFWGNFDH